MPRKKKGNTQPEASPSIPQDNGVPPDGQAPEVVGQPEVDLEATIHRLSKVYKVLSPKEAKAFLDMLQAMGGRVRYSPPSKQGGKPFTQTVRIYLQPVKFLIDVREGG